MTSSMPRGRRERSKPIELAIALNFCLIAFAPRTSFAQADPAPEAPADKPAAEAEADAEEPAEEPEAADAPEAAPAVEGEAAADAKLTIEPPEEKATPPASEIATDPAVPGPDDDMSEQKNNFRRTKPYPTTLDWSGGLETDIGYARYTFDNETLHPEQYYDFRGRFVFGPSVTYRFKKDWFLAARGEAVLWIREQGQRYQINVDDVYAQIGQRGVWDLKAGRFRTWRVYHKGLGFDLYTLEDQGACRTNPCDPETASYGPHTYEVSYIYDRETAGHLAAHVYPTSWSGIEVAAVYGAQGVSNTLGGRGAGMVYFPFLRVSAAGEYRRFTRAEEITTQDPAGNVFTCPRCYYSEWYGFGGGAEVTLRPIEVGLNAARGYQSNYTATGELDQDGSHMVTSLGGYAELDVGLLAVERSLILGFGLNRTEVLADSENFQQHYQGAAYVAYPLGFNAASIKLVLSRATLTQETDTNDDGVFEALPGSAMTAARFRLTYPF